MTTASPRADVDLVIGYDLSVTGRDYSAITVCRRNADGSLDMIDVSMREENLSRDALLAWAFDVIKQYSPRSLCIRCGAAEPKEISRQTMDAILSGDMSWQDLLVGS